LFWVMRRRTSPFSQAGRHFPRIRGYLLRSLIGVSRLSLAVEARHIARDHSLKPGDAVHLASAIRAKADVLLRWDDRFKGLPNISGLDICDPYWYGPAQLPGIVP